MIKPNNFPRPARSGRTLAKNGLILWLSAMTSLAAVAAVGPAIGQSNPNQSTLSGSKTAESAVQALPLKNLTPEQKRQLYEQHQQQLDQVNKERDALSRDVDTMAFERARLKSELIEKARLIKEAERKLSATEKDIFELKVKEQLKRDEFRERRGEMAKILAVLQRFGRQPPPVMVTERKDALSMVRSGILLAHSFQTIKPLADKLAADLNEMQSLTAKLEERQRRQKRLLAELSRRRQEIEPALMAQHSQMKANQARLDLLKAVAAKHAKAMNTLGDIVTKLDTEVAAASGLGAYESELKSGAIELKPEAKKLAFVQPGRMKPSIPFHEARGLLPPPAEGQRVLNFGSPDGFGGVSKGIRLETRDRAQVTAPCDGWVVYADNLRNYGQLLIINAGGGYHILLAGMERIQVSLGQFVLAGEPVAIMGSEARSGESGKASKPVLYVEFRKDQKPIDPDPWWSSGIEKG